MESDNFVKIYKYKITVCHDPIHSFYEDIDEYFIPYEPKTIFNCTGKVYLGIDSRKVTVFYAPDPRNRTQEHHVNAKKVPSPLIEVKIPVNLYNKIRACAEADFKYKTISEELKDIKKFITRIGEDIESKKI